MMAFVIDDSRTMGHSSAPRREYEFLLQGVSWIVRSGSFFAVVVRSIVSLTTGFRIPRPDGAHISAGNFQTRSRASPVDIYENDLIVPVGTSGVFFFPQAPILSAAMRTERTRVRIMGGWRLARVFLPILQCKTWRDAHATLEQSTPIQHDTHHARRSPEVPRAGPGRFVPCAFGLML